MTSFDALVREIEDAIEAAKVRADKADALADEIGEDALAECLRRRGWVVSECEDDSIGWLCRP